MAAPVYATADALRNELRIVRNEDDIADRVERAIRHASRMIDLHFHRPPGWFLQTTPSTRYFDVPSDDLTILDVAEMASAPTSVKIDQDGDGVYEVTLTSPTDYWLGPSDDPFDWPKTQIILNPLGSQINQFATGYRRLQMTGVFGYSDTLLDPIERATLLLAGRYYERGNTPLGVAGSPDTGVVTLRKTDPDVAAILDEIPVGRVNRWVFA